MPPFDPNAQALQVGDLLGLSEGLDGPNDLRIQPGAYDRFERSLAITNALISSEPASYQRYLAELVALYLPSLFELVCNNSLKDFDAVDDRLASGLANLLLDLVHHRHASRFARDHPTKVAALGPKLLRLIIAVADRFETDDPQIFLLTDLLRIYSTLWIYDRMSKDASDTVDSLQISPALRAKLRKRYSRMEAYGLFHDTDADRLVYKKAWASLRAGVFPEDYTTRRGTDFIDRELASGRGPAWWVCEVKKEDSAGSSSPSACESVRRDELRTCARCLSVQYCSQRHQKLHWKQHKPDCVAPSW